MFTSSLCYPHDFHRIVDHLAAPYPVQSASYAPRRRYIYSRRHESPLQRYRLFLSHDDEPNYDTKIDPAVRFTNEADKYGLEVEVPGFSKPQINVEFTDKKTLRISGSTAPVEQESQAVDMSPKTAAQAHTEAPSEATAAEIPRSSASPSPSIQSKRTSIEEVRDESEGDYVDVGSPTSGRSRSASMTSPATNTLPSQDMEVVDQPKRDHVDKKPVYTRSFDKSFEVPADADREKVSAELKDGILRILIEKVAPEASRRRVAVL